ncbi:Transcription factor DYT1, partial [Bienertia sinuspersici]
MTKAYIIKDAITYIEELDSQVSKLKDELMELGNNTPPKEETKPAIIKGEINITAKEMIKNYGIEIKMGGFSKLVETINRLGLEFSDTNLTTSNGTAVISSCLEGMNDGYLNVQEARELIMN